MGSVPRAETDGRMNTLTLRTLAFEDLSVGMTERFAKTVASSDVVGFAAVTGDRNPIHLSEHFAAKTPFGTRIAHGLYTFGAALCVFSTYWSIAFIVLVQLNYAIAPRFTRGSRN